MLGRCWGQSCDRGGVGVGVENRGGGGDGTVRRAAWWSVLWELGTGGVGVVCGAVLGLMLGDEGGSGGGVVRAALVEVEL